MIKSKQTSKHWRLHTRERRTLLLVGDLLVAALALLVALYVWASRDQWLSTLDFLRERPAIWFYLLPFFWLILLVELYDLRHSSSWKATFWGVMQAALVGFGVYLLFYFFQPPKSLPRRGVATFLTVAVAFTLVWRWLYIKIFTAPGFLRRVLVVGAGRSGQEILNVIQNLWPPPFYVVGVLDDDSQKWGSQIAGFPVLNGNDQLLEIVAAEGVSDILVAINGGMRGDTFQSLLDAQEQGITITRMPVVYEEILRRVPIHHLEADWLLRSFVEQTRVNGFYEMGKRMLDILGALVGIALMIGVFPVVSLLVLLDDGWPLFFGQQRVGRGGKTYKLWKFRTMRNLPDAPGQEHLTQESDERTTRSGRFLRQAHLDELPQFWNILRGDMSLVGPRPEQPGLVAKFQQQIPFYRARLMVKPGLTGWAQVNFGYAATVKETSLKLEYDLYYIKHRTFWMDLVILLRTPATMFGLRGR